MKKLFAILLLVNTSLTWAGAPFLTVGADNDNACDYHTIQGAINSGISNTIRIASNKSYFESLEISTSNQNQGNEHLIGGYADCTQAGLNITDLSQAIVTGNGTDPVLEISHTNGMNYDVKVQNMILANGNSGIYVTAQNSSVTKTHLVNVKSLNNSYGMHIFSFNSGVPVVHVEDSLIGFNEQGVYCSGSGAEFRMGGNSVVENNQALSHGAGLALYNGCEGNIYSPTVIKNNETDNSGGGIYVTNSTLNVIGAGPFCEDGICMGDLSSPVVIDNNVADADDNNLGSGGGIYIGSTSNATIINAHIKDNQGRQGGGMYVSSGSTVTAVGYESPATPCWATGACLQFEGNSSVWGGAVYAVNENTDVTIAAAKFTGQSGSAGVVAHVRNDATLEIKDSLLFNNGLGGQGDHSDEELLDIYDGNMSLVTTLTVDGVTIADNHLTGQVVENLNGQLNVYSSLIFDEQDVYLASGNNSPQNHFECVIAHENSSFTAGGTVSVVDRQLQPVFVNPQGGNYHLRVDSPAIDYCYDASGNASTDIDYDTRGVDNPEVDNIHGPYDLGADEFNIANDIIFKHGFEQD
ncbi:MAG: hypothetical protein R3E90_02615 [Marinicella sp.]